MDKVRGRDMQRSQALTQGFSTSERRPMSRLEFEKGHACAGVLAARVRMCFESTGGIESAEGIVVMEESARAVR